MEISDFTFKNRQINRQNFETVLTNKDGVSFICSYRSNSPAPNETIFNEFLKNGRQFTIEVQSEIIPDNPVVELTAPIENNSPPIEINT